VFNKLELTDPDDARVWYYSALCHGLVTRQWGGGTASRVERGMERERAGSPSKADLEAAFSDLSADAGKSWLDSYRQRVSSLH
jgi:hypothetical protein